jgi:hypothetical protein
LAELCRQAKSDQLFVGPDDIPEAVLIEGVVDVVALAKAVATVN